MIKKIILLIFSFLLIISNGIVFQNVVASDTSSCTSSSCINSPNFEISVSNFSPIDTSSGVIKGTTKETINYTLGTIIQKLMIGIGSFAILIMTIGAGYIIIYHGEDELLSKGKYMFLSGIIALVVSLSSYYLVSLFRYLLYN